MYHLSTHISIFKYVNVVCITQVHIIPVHKCAVKSQLWATPRARHGGALAGAPPTSGRAHPQPESAPKAPGSYFDTELDTELDLTGRRVNDSRSNDCRKGAVATRYGRTVVAKSPRCIGGSIPWPCWPALRLPAAPLPPPAAAVSSPGLAQRQGLSAPRWQRPALPRKPSPPTRTQLPLPASGAGLALSSPPRSSLSTPAKRSPRIPLPQTAGSSSARRSTMYPRG